jgi:hypothetical protein
MKQTLLLLLALCLVGASAPEEPVTEEPALAEVALVLSYAQSAKGDVERLKTIMSEAHAHALALGEADKLLFQGERAVEAQAILLYAVMYNESGMRPHIEHCDCSKGDGDCDHGEAFGLPQIHVEHFRGHTRDEVCSDRRLQIELASAVLAQKKQNCERFELTIGSYNAGGCVIPAPPPPEPGKKPMPGYVDRAKRVFEILARRAQIDVRWRGKDWVATTRER